MIKNIILDVAGVLVDFDWKKRFLELGIPEERVDFFGKATLQAPEWPEFDRGVWSDEKVLHALLSHAPGEEDTVRLIWDQVSKAVKQRSFAKDWIRFLQEKGYKVFILSNWPGKIYKECKKELDFEELADGVVFSCEVKMIKPDREIYEEVLKRFGLLAGECVFIDDTAVNLPAPASMGIHTIQFVTFEQVQKELASLGVPAFEL